MTTDDMPKIERQEYEDRFCGLYDSVEDAYEKWSNGCGEELDEYDEDYDVDEDGLPNYCNGMYMCDFCREELQRIEEDAENARKKEREVKEERFEIAKEEFMRRAKEIYPDIDELELHELLEENFQHNGMISQTIAGSLYGECETVFDLDDVAISNLIQLLRISHNRHANTDYDELLKRGTDREVAREMIKIGV